MDERVETGETAPTDFIREIIDADLAAGKHSRIRTRFPPEPNGYLHLGHAKSICLNFGVAEQYGGVCHLRFDDTNPETEDLEYVESIQHDVRWLGFDWKDRIFFASDYFERLYEHAEHLIRTGKAYVDSLSEEEIREHRGTVTEPGRPSPYRERGVDENLDLFRRMRAGEFEDGTHVLRARGDLSASNMKMRDPLLYRIRHASHYRTADAWCIYPMYDFTHCLSDAIEGITHSLCTLEFENNRAIYDWVLENTEHPHLDELPRQYEFARLALTYTVLSKRKLLQLVEERHVDGWDDPRMPTLSGIRRRGYTPEAIRSFCDRIGIAKTNSTVDVTLLENAVRDDLNHRAPRVMAVLDPLKVVIENYPKDRVEELDAPSFPPDVGKPGSRAVPFSRELFVERSDFAEDPPKGFHRLSPGAEVRLRFAYVIRCERVIRDVVTGEIVELRCSYDPDTLSGKGRRSSKRVKGTIHWVSAPHAVRAQVRLYDRLFADPRPDRGKGGPDFLSFLNPGSLLAIEGALLEPSVAGTEGGRHFQFERHGYFFSDPVTSRPDALVFNRSVPLRDSWAKVAREADGAAPEPKATPAARPRDDARVVGAPSEPRAPRPRRPVTPRTERTPRLEAKRTRYTRELGLSDADAWLLTERMEIAELFEAALGVHPDNPKGVANWVLNDLLRELKDVPVEELPFGGGALGELVALVDSGAVSVPAGRRVLAKMMAEGGAPAAIVAELGLEQVDDESALASMVGEVLAAHPAELERYRGGQTKLRGFFLGQVMKASGGTANPSRVGEILDRLLGG